MLPDPDAIFDTREEAERARDRLNQAPLEYGYGEWYLGGPVDGKWRVIRWRGLMAEEVGGAKSYEQSFRREFERRAMNHDFWRDTEGIRFEAVELEGEYPDTKLVLLFRRVASERFSTTGYPECVFGVRWPIWPTADPNAADAASDQAIEFEEYLDTDRRASLFRRGPCDPAHVNWLE